MLGILPIRGRHSHPLRRPLQTPIRARVRGLRSRQLRLNLASLLVVRKPFMADQQIAMVETQVSDQDSSRSVFML